MFRLILINIFFKRYKSLLQIENKYINHKYTVEKIIVYFFYKHQREAIISININKTNEIIFIQVVQHSKSKMDLSTMRYV